MCVLAHGNQTPDKLQYGFCSITFLKFAFSISATRTQGKVLPVSGPLWCIVIAQAFPLHKVLSSCKARANLTGSHWTILSEEGEGWNPPFSSLAVLAEGIWQAWGGFQHLPHFPREKSGGCATLACKNSAWEERVLCFICFLGSIR